MPRLLYLPNEGEGWKQVGPRAFFEDLCSRGEIAEYNAYSFKLEWRKLRSAPAVNQCIVELALDMKPDVVFWQHPGGFPVSPRTLERIRSLSPRPLVVYHELDAWGGRKRPTPSMAVLARAADLVFLNGLGKLAKLFSRMGARLIEYCPDSADLERFGAPLPRRERPRFDVVSIGSRVVSRYPLLTRLGWSPIEGAQRRAQAVRCMGETFGERFGLFGLGWEGFPGNRGFLPYDQQHGVIADAALTFAWDHFESIPYYFSDRLPVSLIAGVAHLTNYKPGFEHLFSNGRELAWVRRVDEVVDAARFLLSQGQEALWQMGERGRAYAMRHLATSVVFSRIWQRVVALLDAVRSSDGGGL